MTDYQAAVSAPRTLDISCPAPGCGTLLGHITRAGKDEPFQLTLSDELTWGRDFAGDKRLLQPRTVRAMERRDVKSRRLAKVRSYALPLRVGCVCRAEFTIQGSPYGGPEPRRQ